MLAAAKWRSRVGHNRTCARWEKRRRVHPPPGGGGEPQTYMSKASDNNVTHTVVFHREFQPQARNLTKKVRFVFFVSSPARLKSTEVFAFRISAGRPAGRVSSV